MTLQSLLFVGTGGQFSFQASHASYHGVEVLEDLVRRRGVGEAGICSVLEALFDSSTVSFHGKLGNLEILPQQLIGKTQ